MVFEDVEQDVALHKKEGPDVTIHDATIPDVAVLEEVPGAGAVAVAVENGAVVEEDVLDASYKAAAVGGWGVHVSPAAT